jgi:hypothetical protein
VVFNAQSAPCDAWRLLPGTLETQREGVWAQPPSSVHCIPLQPTTHQCVFRLSHLPALLPLPHPQEAPLEALLADLSDLLQLPPGSLSPDALQAAAPTDAPGALAVASADGGKRLLLAAPPVAGGSGPAQGAKQGSAGEQPLLLTATVVLEPDSAEASGSPFSAALAEAALLAAAAAASPGASPVRLSGAAAGRLGVCGNAICEVGERSVQGSLNGTCPQDCAFESKVGARALPPIPAQPAPLCLVVSWHPRSSSDAFQPSSPPSQAVFVSFPPSRPAPAAAVAAACAWPPAAPATALRGAQVPPARTAAPALSRCGQPLGLSPSVHWLGHLLLCNQRAVVTSWLL